MCQQANNLQLEEETFKVQGADSREGKAETSRICYPAVDLATKGQGYTNAWRKGIKNRGKRITDSCFSYFSLMVYWKVGYEWASWFLGRRPARLCSWQIEFHPYESAITNRLFYEMEIPTTTPPPKKKMYLLGERCHLLFIADALSFLTVQPAKLQDKVHTVKLYRLAKILIWIQGINSRRNVLLGVI